MFRRLSSGDTKGSGVGLTAVQRLMKRVGGRVLLDSAPGQGARFTLEFAVRPV
jgi:two-component system OmpR family sensor kinase